MATIIIHQKSALEGAGTHVHHACKPVFSPDLNVVWNSVTDAAEFFGCDMQHVSHVLNGNKRIRRYERDENGKRIRYIDTVCIDYVCNFDAYLNSMMDEARSNKTHLSASRNAIRTITEERNALRDDNISLRSELNEVKAQHARWEQRMAGYLQWKQLKDEIDNLQRIYETSMAAAERAQKLLEEARNKLNNL